MQAMNTAHVDLGFIPRRIPEGHHWEVVHRISRLRKGSDIQKPSSIPEPEVEPGSEHGLLCRWQTLREP